MTTSPTSTQSLPLDDVISVEQFSPAMLEEIFTCADYMQAALRNRSHLPNFANRVVALIFFEPSSRTILSFQAAAARLGAGVIVHQSAEASSLTKGESLEDTMRIVGGYADTVVLRHKEAGAAERAAQACPVPVINGGDGSNEHPTQAMIDLYTLRQEVGRLSGLRVGLGFDPLHSRSIHSLCRALSLYPDNEIVLVAPDQLAAGDDFVSALRQRGLKVDVSSSVDALRDCNVVYLNRFQVERFSDQNTAMALRDRYRIDAEFLRGTDIQVILDPLPRIHEIDEDVDSLNQAAYFRQAAFGVPVRMALLSLLIH